MLESEPPLHRSSSNLTTCIPDNVELSRAPRRASYFYGVLLALPGFLRTILRTQGISWSRGAIGHSIFLDKKWRNATASCFNPPEGRADLQRKIDSTIGLDTRGKVHAVGRAIGLRARMCRANMPAIVRVVGNIPAQRSGVGEQFRPLTGRKCSSSDRIAILTAEIVLRAPINHGAAFVALKKFAVHFPP